MSGLFGNNKPTTGGLFGGGGSSSGGSIFGGGNKSGGGGLFGGSKPAGASSGGIFGSSNPSQGQPSSGGGGLFGGGATRTGGGLFGGGGASTASKPGGLFGASSGGSGGSIFGGSSTKPSTFGGSTSGGGIFGSSSGNSMSSTATFGGGSGTSGGGLFGSKPSTSGGGLFGAKPSTGGGLFGASSNSASGSGMFGSNSMGENSMTQSANLENGTVNISNFSGIKDKDNSNDSKTMINLNAITADPSLQNFSLEELRLADYILKKQGKANFPIGAQPGQNKGFMGSKPGGFSGSSFGSKPAGGGLFGSSSTTASTTGGGLFGSSSTQAKTGGGLFGSSTTASTTSTTGGGLFGASKPATGGGLFGASTAAKGIGTLQRSNATTSLFGAKPATASTGGGLFGSSTSGTSAFGAKPAGGGLFGTSGTSSGGGLFGSTAQKPAFGASTFGASSGGSSLFSKPATGGGLFGGGATSSTQQATLQPQPDMSYIQAYSSLTQDPYGLKDLESAFKLHTIDADKQVILNKLVDQVLQYSGQKSPKTVDSHNLYSQDTYNYTAYTDMPIKIKLQRRGGDHDRHYDSSRGMINSRRLDNHDRSNFDRFQEQERRSRMIDYTRAKTDIDLSTSIQYADERRKLRETANFLEKSKPTTTQDVLGSTEQNSQKYTTFRPHRENNDQILTGPNIIRVKVSVFVQDGEEVLILSIDKTRKIENLKELIISKLKHNYPDIESTIIRIVHKSRILNEDNTLVSSGIENGM